MNTRSSINIKGMIGRAICMLALGIFATHLTAFDAEAREVNYAGSEIPVYVKPGEPTQITFQSEVKGGFKRKHSGLALERQENFVIVFPKPDLPVDGEALIIHTIDDSYSIRVIPSTDQHPRDDFVRIIDNRQPLSEEGPPQPDFIPSRDFAPPTVVSGLMREMVLVAEFGKRGGIPGYRRSNRYAGETILHDGSLEATIDEIYMGPDLWGYVLNVENKLDTTQRINPATFRLDGTRAVLAERWELSPRPLTAEQKISGAHQGKIYIVTKSKRR